MVSKKKQHNSVIPEGVIGNLVLKHPAFAASAQSETHPHPIPLPEGEGIVDTLHSRYAVVSDWAQAKIFLSAGCKTISPIESFGDD